MTTGTTLRTALLGIALGTIFIPVISGKSQAQHVDLNAAAEAKSEAGREALAHPPTDPRGPKTAGAFIAFDVPGAVSTYPSSINPAGAITGSYFDANFITHGFLRASNGTITTFDVPGLTQTGGTGINPAGAITGNYVYINDPKLCGSRLPTDQPRHIYNI